MRWALVLPRVLHPPHFVAYTRRTLRGGTELTYNYDAHLRSDAFTMDFAKALARGRTDRPCRRLPLRRPRPVPKQQFLPLNGARQFN
jgi:hypothetical protein